MILLESFNTLLRDPAHWQFELLVGFVEMVVFDLVIGVLVWPLVKRHVHFDVKHAAVHMGRPLSQLAQECIDADPGNALELLPRQEVTSVDDD